MKENWRNHSYPGEQHRFRISRVFLMSSAFWYGALWSTQLVMHRQKNQKKTEMTSHLKLQEYFEKFMVISWLQVGQALQLWNKPHTSTTTPRLVLSDVMLDCKCCVGCFETCLQSYTSKIHDSAMPVNWRESLMDKPVVQWLSLGHWQWLDGVFWVQSLSQEINIWAFN